MQSWQAVCPRVPWKVPGAHKRQMSVPLLPAWLPGKQSVQAASEVEPGTGLALPTGQLMHDALLDAPSVGL